MNRFNDYPTMKYLVFDSPYGITPEKYLGASISNEKHYYAVKGTIKTYALLSSKDIISSNKGNLGYGFFERWGMPMNVDGGDDKDLKKVEEKKSARQTMLDYICPKSNLLSRLVFDIDQDNIPSNDSNEYKAFSWTTMVDNFNTMFGKQFQQSNKPVVYSIIGYSTLEAFNVFFRDIKDSFKDIEYEDLDLQTEEAHKTFKAKYLIDDSHVIIIELRDNKEEAGHVFSAHIVTVNAFFNVNDFHYLQEHKYQFYGCDANIYSPYRNMRCQWSIKCRMFLDENKETHKKQAKELEGVKLNQAYNKAIHHHGIISSLMSDVENAEDIWCKIFLAGYYSYDELPSDFEDKYILINFDEFGKETTSLIPDEYKTKKTNQRIQKIPVSAKKINNNINISSGQYVKLDVILADINNNYDGDCELYFKDHSIFEIFDSASCYQFKGSMLQLTHNHITYFPLESFVEELKKWYNQQVHKHPVEELIFELTENTETSKVVEEVPKIEGASSLNKLRNLYYNYLYQDKTFNELDEAFKDIKEKLYKKKKCTSKELPRLKSIINEVVANITKNAFEDAEDYKPATEDPSLKELLKMEVADIETYSKFMLINELSDEYIQNHYKQVLERLNIIFKQVQESNNENTNLKKKIMDYIDSYVIDKWYNELLQKMFENRYKTCLKTGIYNKLYYTVNRKQYYHIIQKKDKNKVIFNHEEEIEKDVIANLTPKGSKKFVSIDLLNQLPDYSSQEELKEKLMTYKEEHILKQIPDLKLDNFLETAIETDYYDMLHKWLVQYRNTFTCEDDFNFCLSWYAHKLNGECLDRHMLNYGNADCLKSTLVNMCERAGYDFLSVNSHKITDKFDAPYKNHLAVCVEEFEKLEDSECSKFVEDIKAMYGKDTIMIQDKNVKSHNIIHKVDYDITTNETSYAAIKIFTGNVQAVLKRIAPIERKPLSQEVIQNLELFPKIIDNPTALTFFIYWLKNIYPKWTKEQILRYKIKVSQVEIARDVQDNQYTKLTVYDYQKEGKYNVLCGIRQLIHERSDKYIIQFGQVKTFRNNVLKNLNIEIYPEFKSIPEFKEYLNNKLNIKVTFHTKQLILDNENVNKWFESFSLVNYDSLCKYNEEAENYVEPDWQSIENKLDEQDVEEELKQTVSRPSKECIDALLSIPSMKTSNDNNVEMSVASTQCVFEVDDDNNVNDSSESDVF